MADWYSTTHTTPLDKAFDEGRQALEKRHQQELEQQALAARAISQIQGEFSRLNLAFGGLDSTNYICMTFLPDGPTISIGLYDLESLKDPRLTSTLGVFMGWGDPEVVQNDWSVSPDRTFMFQKDLGTMTVRVHVRGSVSVFSKTCRKVQVGTEVVEKPRYEIVCE